MPNATLGANFASTGALSALMMGVGSVLGRMSYRGMEWGERKGGDLFLLDPTIVRRCRKVLSFTELFSRA